MRTLKTVAAALILAFIAVFAASTPARADVCILSVDKLKAAGIKPGMVANIFEPIYGNNRVIRCNARVAKAKDKGYLPPSTKTYTDAIAGVQAWCGKRCARNYHLFIWSKKGGGKKAATSQRTRPAQQRERTAKTRQAAPANDLAAAVAACGRGVKFVVVCN